MAKKKSRSKSSGPVKITGAERLIVFHGEETFLKEAYLGQARNAVEKAQSEEVEVIRMAGPDAALADVMDELRTMGLMQQFKVVVVTDADPFIKLHREALERYADDPAEQAMLVLLADTWNAKWKLHKAAQKIGQVVGCDRVAPSVATRWVINRMGKQYERKIDSQAAHDLVERMGTDLYRLDSELAKLSLTVEPGETVTWKQIEMMVGRSSERDAYQIQAAILSGQANQLLATIRELIDVAGHHEMRVAYFVSDITRKLAQAAIMLEQGVNESQIIDKLKVWQPQLKRPLITMAKQLGSARAGYMLDQLAVMDARSKSGYATSVRNLQRFAVLLTASTRYTGNRSS